MEDFQYLITFIQNGIYQAADTAQLFLNTLNTQFSFVGVVDIALVVIILSWLARKLRRSDLIKVVPRLLILLVIILISRLLGLWAVFYLGGFLLLVSMLAIASLYATEIKNILEVNFKRTHSEHKVRPVNTADLQAMIQSVTEAMSVLVRSQKSVLIVIKKQKALTRLIENGTKMNSQLKPELIIDFFTSGSALSKGAVIIEGNHIVSAGSSLWRPNAKVLFNLSNPAVARVGKDLGAVVIITNKTLGDINLLDGDNTYKNLSPQDLTRLLQNIFIYNSKD